MNRVAITLSLAAAFAAGCGVTHLLRPALAAENITAQVIHTGDLEGDALSPANAGGMRNKTFVAADGATISIQDGSPPKHLHRQRQRDPVHPRRHRHDLARRQGSDGEAGRSRHHPQGHAACRHQA